MDDLAFEQLTSELLALELFSLVLAFELLTSELLAFSSLVTIHHKLFDT